MMKKDVNTIGWLLLIGLIFFNLTVVVVMLGGMLFGCGDEILMLSSDAGSLVANVLILGVFWIKRRKDIILSGKRTENPWVLVGVTWMILLAWNMSCSFLDIATNKIFSIPVEGTGMASLTFNLVSIAVFPAIVEEFAFRKVIFGVLRKHGFAVAAIFSSLCFGLMHQNIIQIIFATGMGMMMCYVYEHTAKLYYCMLLHFANNGLSVVLGSWDVYNKYSFYIEAILGIISVAVLFVMIVVKKNVLKEVLQIDKEHTGNQVCGDLKLCFTRVPVIIYGVFCVSLSIVAIFI